MESEKDAFYVVRKGDVIGVYRDLSDCLAQSGSSICELPQNVYKGYCLPNEAEQYLASRGLKNPLYCINASDVQEDLFGDLVPCPLQQPVSLKAKHSDNDNAQKRLPQVHVPEEVQPASLKANIERKNKISLIQKRLQQVHGPEEVDCLGSTSTNPQRKHVKVETSTQSHAVSSGRSCILAFDGASRGNPGQAGAGAVLYAEDGSCICRLREGVGWSTNNVAEYRGLILGLKYALFKGFRHIRVQGDSNLVCMQVQGHWKTKNQNMTNLCKVAKDLKDKFVSFHISHVERACNSEADAQANLGLNLRDGQVEEEVAK